MGRITAFLFDEGGDESPSILKGNSGKAFIGVKVYGQGFLFADSTDAAVTPIDEMRRLITSDPRNCQVIKEYLGGEDINDNPQQRNSRYVIDFGDMNENDARKWPEVFAIVERRVRPGRVALTNQAGAARMKEYWWQYYHAAKDLYKSISGKQRCLVASQTSKYAAWAFSSVQRVFSHKVVVVAFDTNAAFGLMQSRLHSLWAQSFGSTMKDDPVYTPSDCFETFPFPENFEDDPVLETAGQAYHDHRSRLMIARNQGMTPTYNRFHDRTDQNADIVRLRELHAEMDVAVLRAYGWDDLADRAQAEWLGEHNEDDHKYQGRYFWPAPFRDEVLARLLALNAERAAAEKDENPK